MNSLFDKKLEPRCEYCAHATVPADRSFAMCRFRGINPLSGKCRKFRYDPLMRIPQAKLSVEKYKAEDFAL